MEVKHCSSIDATIPLGERLRQLRKQANFNQAEMAALVGTNQGRICEWENGKHHPQLTSLARYADAFDTTVSELLDGVLLL